MGRVRLSRFRGTAAARCGQGRWGLGRNNRGVRPLALVLVGGGLGNRLRAAVTAPVWGEATGRNVRIAWPTSPDFSAQIDDLFEHHLPLVTPALVRMAGAALGYESVRTAPPRGHRPLTVISSGSAFRDPDGRKISPAPELQRLRPTTAVLQRMADIAPPRGPRLGVMIRAHADAMAKTVQRSPVEWFERRIHDLRRTGTDFEVFLSTDSPEAAERLESSVGPLFRLHDKRPHNSRYGLIDAVADLYLLARCDYILGSHRSSFSETAASFAPHGGYETAGITPAESWAERIARH